MNAESKTKLVKTGNLVANVLLIIIVVVAFGIGLKYFFFAPSLESFESSHFPAGASVQSPAISDFITSGDTIVLALDVECGYCHESTSFYQRLADLSSNKGNKVRVVGLFKNPESDVRNFLKSNGLTIEYKANVNLTREKFDLTPTILWIAADGQVKGSFEGYLSESLQTALLERIELSLGMGS